MIFNELIENVKQMKLRNHKVILEVSLDLKIYFIYTVYLFCMKKSAILISFLAQKLQNSL